MIRVAWVRRSVLNPELTGWKGLPWAMVALLVAWGLRAALDPLVSGVPFLTFFPAVQIASLLLGWRWGSVVLGGSALVANFAFQAPFMAFTVRSPEIVASLSFLLAGALMIWASETLRQAMVALTEAARRESELKLELSHRVNNSFTVIQGLAKQTARVHPQPESFYEIFSGRVKALSDANKILLSGATELSQMSELAAAAVKPFSARQQVNLNGPNCAIPSASTVPVMMALHELGANATKYGALSVPGGRVEVTWFEEDGSCRLLWQEVDGPPVKKPERKGLGTRLLARQPGLDEVNVVFDPLGVRCEILMKGIECPPA